MNKNEPPKYTDRPARPADRYTIRPEHDAAAANEARDEVGRPPPDRPQETDEQRRRRLLREWKELSGQTWTPWLLMRYRLNDLGYRPIPAGEAHWCSPDVYIESSDPNGNGVAGQANFVHARIFNLGKAGAIPTRVDFHWADPSLGLGPGSMNLIGTEWVEVPTHRVIDVRCNTPWIPVFVNNGHECLMVNCSNAILDPITEPFSPRLDRHVGQRNVTVLEGNAGQALTFRLAVANLFARSSNVTIAARIEHVEIDPQALENVPFRQVLDHALDLGAGAFNTGPELLARYVPGTAAHRRVMTASGWIPRRKGTGAYHPGLVRSVQGSGQPARNLPCIGGAWEDHRCLVRSADACFAEALRESAKVLVDRGRADDLVMASTELAAFEQRKLRLELGIPTSARPGELVVYHVAQRMQGVTAGGYTVVVKVVGR